MHYLKFAKQAPYTTRPQKVYDRFYSFSLVANRVMVVVVAVVTTTTYDDEKYSTTMVIMMDVM